MADKEKRYYWLKLKDDFFTQKEIKKLRKIAGGDTYTIIYLKMLLKSLKDNGSLYFEGVDDNFQSELALDIDEDETNVQVTINFLKAQGILVETNQDEFHLVTCDEMVGNEAFSTKRARECRARKVLQCNTDATQMQHDATQMQHDATQMQHDATQMQHDATKRKEIEKEIDIEKEKETDREKKKTITSVLNSYAPVDSDLRNALNEFKEMRSKKKKPLTVRALEQALNKLDKLSANDEMTKIAIVDQTLQHSWDTFYELKVDKEQQQTGKTMQEEADDLADYIASHRGGMFD